MDEKELALELFRLYVENHRERMSIDEFIETFAAIYQVVEALSKGVSPQISEEKAPEEHEESGSLFDFKEPISLSKKEE